MTITEAVRELRRLSGKSQQFFATELNMSTRSLQQYEAGKTPEPKQLVAFAAYAHSLKRNDIQQIMTRTLNEELQPPPGYYLMIQFGPLESSPLRRKKQ